jgi:hypothetical protein
MSNFEKFHILKKIKIDKKHKRKILKTKGKPKLKNKRGQKVLNLLYIYTKSTIQGSKTETPY